MELGISGLSEEQLIYELRAPILTIGRAADNDIAVQSDPWLSRYHLKFEFSQPEGWFVRDLGTRNGSVVNEVPLLEPHPLRAGDRIYAGHLTIEVRDGDRQKIDSNIDFVFERELEEARELQRSLIPSNPVIPGYDIAGSTVIAQSVGGDCYDFIPYTHGRLCILFSDVSGKGLEAARAATLIRDEIRTAAETGPDPASLLTSVNEMYCAKGLGAMRFATVFVSVLNPATGVLRYANAGHNAPCLIRNGGKLVQLSGSGLVIGVDPTVIYDLYDVEIRPGEMVAISSDGILEAFNEDGGEFGDSGLSKYVLSHLSEHCAEIAHQLPKYVLQWSHLSQPTDDLTAILIRRL